MTIRGVFDPAQLSHSPERELHNGEWIPHSEIASRAEQIASALGKLHTATDHGVAPLCAVHDEDYVAFLRSAHERWIAADRTGDAIGYTFAIGARRPLNLERIDALLGRYSFDAATPVGPGTWDAAYASAQSALTALDFVIAGDRASFALCRPPGHHAGRDYFGGYCYLNNAAIAAQAARASGIHRVAVLDVDYHHGNGTQDIFWTRSDVFYASIHADPATDYPYYWGHTDERGEGDGAGHTLNLPLPRGTKSEAYRHALGEALDAIGRFDPGLLVVSYGADTWEGDPISQFALSTADMASIGQDIAERGIPRVVVMEGGYAVDAIGANVASFLSRF